MQITKLVGLLTISSSGSCILRNLAYLCLSMFHKHLLQIASQDDNGEHHCDDEQDIIIRVERNARL